jgi:hypothetical protein
VNAKIDLSIIIPAYMEAAGIGDSLKTLAKWLDSHDYGTVEVMVITAHSPDGTAEIARRHGHLFVIHKGLMRKLMSKSANITAQLLVTPGIKDTQCGFKVFRDDVALDIFGRMTMLSWSFDMEILAIARTRHYHIEFIQAPDWKDPKAAGQGLVGDSMIKVVLNGFMDPFKMRLNIWTGVYRRRTYRHKTV